MITGKQRDFPLASAPDMLDGNQCNNKMKSNQQCGTREKERMKIFHSIRFYPLSVFFFFFFKAKKKKKKKKKNRSSIESCQHLSDVLLGYHI